MGRKSRRRAIADKKKSRREKQRTRDSGRGASSSARLPAAAPTPKAPRSAPATSRPAPSKSATSTPATAPRPDAPPVIPGRKPLLEVRGLRTRFHTESGVANAVNGVDFDIYEGEVLGLVGESGSGKSVCSLSIMRLIPNPPGEIFEGSIRFRGRELLDLPWEEMRRVRGKDIAMIFQEPMTSLNPVYTVGFQVTEVLLQHEPISKAEAWRRGVELLNEVGIPDAERRMSEYPHQFSGGMRQRVMIAMALACNPSLLIADEPTTALDVTIQAQILELMQKVKEKRADAATLLITHDLAVVAETCQRVIVLYGGRIQEVANVRELFKQPAHPYTQGLLASLPHPVQGQPKEKLSTIPGMVPNIHAFPAGCRFATRCDKAEPRCWETEPALMKIGDAHWSRCHLVEELVV